MHSRTVGYATNVAHYQHVLDAYRASGVEVRVAMRPAVRKDIASSLANSRIKPVQRFGRLLSKRTVERRPDIDYRWLTPYDLVRPLAGRIKVTLPQRAVLALTNANAKRVANLFADVEYLHFIEGLGHAALRGRNYSASICERRNLHPQAFSPNLDPVGDFPTRLKKDPLSDILDEEFERSSQIIVYSETARQSFSGTGIDLSKIQVAPLYASAPVVSAPASGSLGYASLNNICFVGRGTIDKGLDVAVAAINELPRKFHLYVAGPVNEEVFQWLSRQPKVSYLGILSRQGLARLYDSCSIFVAPSIESFGIAALEAALAGVSVVCRETTGIREYLMGPAHRVVEGRSPYDWAQQILQLVDMLSDDIDAMREATRHGSAHLTEENAVAEWRSSLAVSISESGSS